MQVNVIHDKESQVFYADINGQRAELLYDMPEEGVINFVSTHVPESLRGQGIGKQIVSAGLAYADQSNYRIIPSCRFVVRYVHAQHR